MLDSINADSNNNIKPDIDIISVKMLRVMGIDTSPLTFKVRRRLFGCCDDTDSSSVSNTLAELETEDVRRSTQIWNFDFTKESPLPAGRYMWEKVRDCEVPLVYTCEGSEAENRLPTTQQRDAFHHRNQQTTQSLTKPCDDRHNQMKKSSQKSPNIRLVQTSIKGYGKVQKKAINKLNFKRNHVRFLKSRVANYIINDHQVGGPTHS